MAELNVSRKTIGKLFSEMQGKKFIIPDYQRPYKWNFEKCETLWEDIQNFAQSDAKAGMEYFLGTIVSHINEEKYLEIIDGQQRITSFMLLLRAFYKKLENMPEDEDVIGLKNQLAPCIWDINPISQKVSDHSKIHIESLVVTEEDNQTFHNILEKGEASEDAKDNYSKNFLFFKNKCDEYASTNPMQWKELCITILQKCIILPIECDTQDTALTIFSTLNDRGLPLADSDIFKAQIYRNYTTELDRKEFTEKWKRLTDICNQGGVSVDEIFRYYTHFLRASKSDRSKEMGLRKFYSDDKYKILKDNCLIDQIIRLAEFWRYINTFGEKTPDEEYLINIDGFKYIHCLFHYPNEFWKYPVSVFFIQNYANSDFTEKFSNLLEVLVAFLFAKFIQKPTVNAIKDDIYSICIDLYQNKTPAFRIVLDEAIFNNDQIKDIPARLNRGLLLLHAYLHPKQSALITSSFDIEHILPKKWQDTNYNGWEISDAKQYLEKIGNKIVFEKKLNIQAGNGYFGQKKKKYSASKIEVVREIAENASDDWMKENIDNRQKHVNADLVNFFKRNLLN